MKNVVVDYFKVPKKYIKSNTVHCYGLYPSLNIKDIHKIKIKDGTIYIYPCYSSNSIIGKIRFKKSVIEKLVELRFLEFDDTYKECQNLDFLKNCKKLVQLEIDKNILQNIDTVLELHDLKLVSFKIDIGLNFLEILNRCQNLEHVYLKEEIVSTIIKFQQETGKLWTKNVVYL